MEEIKDHEIEIVVPVEENIRRIYEASKIGSIESLKQLIQQDSDILHKVLVSSSSHDESPLHISVSHGHIEFTRFLLQQKPEFSCEVDSRQRTPLHLASANGVVVEIVRELLEKNTSVCLVRDLNGLIPLHYAVIRGHIEIVQELIKARPQSVLTKLGNNGQTVLHLCVKNNNLEALKLLIEKVLIHDQEFLNSIDESGNTVLDLSLMLRQVEMVRYLLSIPGVKTGTNVGVNFTTSDGRREIGPISSIYNNSNSLSVEEIENIPIREEEEERPQLPIKKRGCWGALKKFMKHKDDWLQEFQGTLMLVATVIATITFYSGINPPGGVWQLDSLTHFNNNGPILFAGKAVMANQEKARYWVYSATNTMSFIASVTSILLIITRFSLRNRIGCWLLTIAMCAAVLFLVIAYLQGIEMISSDQVSTGFEASNIMIYASTLLIEGIGLWFLIRILIWVWKSLLRKFVSRLSRFYQRLCFCVYVFVCLGCAGVLVYCLLVPIIWIVSPYIRT